MQVSKGIPLLLLDYAAVKAAYYKDLVLAAVDSIHANDRHLFTTAADAIADNEHVLQDCLEQQWYRYCSFGQYSQN